MKFSDLTDLQGLVQSYEAKTNLGTGTVTGNYLKEFVREANNSNRIIYSWIFESSGSWQFDDSNYQDMPFATDDLVLGQRDYAIPPEALTIKRIQIKNNSGSWFDVYPVQHDIRDTANNPDGSPMSYLLTGTTIRFNRAPSYNSTNGLKVSFDRDVYEFTANDDTRTPGFSSQFHDAIAVGAAIEWLKNNQPGSPTLQELKAEWMNYEQRIRKFYDKRAKSFKPVLRRLIERWR